MSRKVINVVINEKVTPPKLSLQIPNEPEENQTNELVITLSNFFLEEKDYTEIKVLDLDLMISDFLNLKFQVNQGGIADLVGLDSKWIYYSGMVNFEDGYFLCCINIVQTKNDNVDYVKLVRINMIPIDASL